MRLRTPSPVGSGGKEGSGLGMRVWGVGGLGCGKGTADCEGVGLTARRIHPAPHTLHPAPCTMHPTPYTLHPTPYTLHPAPHTLHPPPPTAWAGTTQTRGERATGSARCISRQPTATPSHARWPKMCSETVIPKVDFVASL